MSIHVNMKSSMSPAIVFEMTGIINFTLDNVNKITVNLCVLLRARQYWEPAATKANNDLIAVDEGGSVSVLRNRYEEFCQLNNFFYTYLEFRIIPLKWG